MRHELKATRRTRTYGFVAFLVAVGLAGWVGYLAWTGRWAQLDPVFATSAIILLWLFTLLDARATVAELRRELEVYERRDARAARQHWDETLAGNRALVDRYGPR